MTCDGSMETMLRSVGPDCQMSIEQVKCSTADGGGADPQSGDPRESGVFGIGGTADLKAYFCGKCGPVRTYRRSDQLRRTVRPDCTPVWLSAASTRL